MSLACFSEATSIAKRATSSVSRKTPTSFSLHISYHQLNSFTYVTLPYTDKEALTIRLALPIRLFRSDLRMRAFHLL